jgi:hypothetical protein
VRSALLAAACAGTLLAAVPVVAAGEPATLDGRTIEEWAAHAAALEQRVAELETAVADRDARLQLLRRRYAQEQRNAVARANTVRWQRAQLRRRWAPTVRYAYRLAAVVYGVPERQLQAVGWCESRHFPFARNGRYRGVMQEGPMFERGPFGQAGFSVWDPIANVMTAAYTVQREGWRQWECKPWRRSAGR